MHLQREREGDLFGSDVFECRYSEVIMGSALI